MAGVFDSGASTEEIEPCNGQQENFVDAVMKEWDHDGDGSVSYEEFLRAVTSMLTDTNNEEMMKQAFSIFDKVGPPPRTKQDASQFPS